MSSTVSKTYFPLNYSIKKINGNLFLYVISVSEVVPNHNDKADVHAFIGNSVEEVSTVTLFEDHCFGLLMLIFPSCRALIY